MNVKGQQIAKSSFQIFQGHLRLKLGPEHADGVSAGQGGTLFFHSVSEVEGGHHMQGVLRLSEV